MKVRRQDGRGLTFKSSIVQQRGLLTLLQRTNEGVESSGKGDLWALSIQKGGLDQRHEKRRVNKVLLNLKKSGKGKRSPEKLVMEKKRKASSSAPGESLGTSEQRRSILGGRTRSKGWARRRHKGPQLWKEGESCQIDAVLYWERETRGIPSRR